MADATDGGRFTIIDDPFARPCGPGALTEFKDFPVVTEYATEMHGGSMQVRNDHPDENACPLDSWIARRVRRGDRVRRRRIIVVEDWQEVTEP